MIADILTVASKELREILTFGGDARGRGKFSLLILVGVFGVFFPLQSGREWVTSSLSIMVWGWMPFLWVSGIVSDLFAGERERHTLEALLATRLSDQAILYWEIAGGYSLWIFTDVACFAGKCPNDQYRLWQRWIVVLPVEHDHRCIGVQYSCFGAFRQHWSIGVPTGGQRPSGAANDEHRHVGLVPAVHAAPVPPQSMDAGSHQPGGKCPACPGCDWACGCFVGC